MNIPKELLQGQDVKPGDVLCFTVSAINDADIELDDTSVEVEPATEEASEPNESPDAPPADDKMAAIMKMPAKDMRKNLPVVER
jgi:hypothetical protein